MFTHPLDEVPATGARLDAWPTNADTGIGDNHVDITREHAVLVRRMARLQTQMSALVRSHERQLHFWQQRLMRQSTRLMLERTRADWGLPLQDAQARAQVRTATAAAEAQGVLCRTGCVMDAQHWREGDTCRRTGQACVLDDLALSPPWPSSMPG